MGIADRERLTAAVHEIAFDFFDKKITLSEMEQRLRDLFPPVNQLRIAEFGMRNERQPGPNRVPVDRKMMAAGDRDSN